ncbi:MAG: MFS transporter [Desulfobacteraceae bacterium]|nr:MAG: MFS transporter [Desulfobacteraceae bacterium]
MSRAWAVFFLASANFLLSQFYRATNAVIAPQLISDLHLDTQDLGFLSAAFFYSFSFTQIPITIFLDRIGARRMMTGFSVAGILGAFVFSWSDSLALGVAGRVLLGIGMACHLMGTLKLLTLWFDPLRFATLSGIVFSLGTVGNMAATSPFAVMVDWMGWRDAYRAIAAANLLLVFIFHAVVRDSPEVSSAKGRIAGAPVMPPQPLADLRILLKNRDYWIISVGSFARYGLFAAFQTLWAGPFLMEGIGLSAIAAGNLIFLLNVGMILAGPLWGALSDRVFRTRKWLVVMALGVLALLFLATGAVGPGTGMVVLLAVFFGIGLFQPGMLMYVQMKETMPLRMAGTAMTGVNFFTMIGAGFFLHVMGSLMQTLYPEASRSLPAFHTAFLLSAAFMGIVTVVYSFTRDTRGIGA